MSWKLQEEGPSRRKEPWAVWICCGGVEKGQAWEGTIVCFCQGLMGWVRGRIGRTGLAGSKDAVPRAFV